MTGSSLKDLCRQNKCSGSWEILGSQAARFLVTQLFSYEKDFDTSGNARTSGDDKLTADAVRRKAVTTYSGNCAGGLLVQPDRVGRRCNVPNPLHTGFHIGYDLVHTGKNQDILRTIAQESQAVPAAVDVDQFAGCGDGVRAHKEEIGAADLSV